MPDVGEIRAFVEPTPGVRRPLRIIASTGPFPAYLVDEDGNTIGALPVIDEASIAAMTTGAQTEVDVHQLLVDIHKEICKQTLILGEMARMEVSDGDIDS